MAGRCPFCNDEGLKSTVNLPGSSVSTAMMPHRFYDEDGRFHHHGGNTITSEYRCSQGHRWLESSKGGCKTCGDEDKVIVRRLDTPS